MFALQMILWLLMVAALAWLTWQKVIRRKVTLPDPPQDNYGNLRRPTIEVSVSFGLAALVLVLFFVGNVCIWRSFGQVPAGSRGVVLQFGAVTGEAKPEGLYVVTPFVNSVELMDVQVHKHATKAGAASKDLQNVATEIALNYRIAPEQAPQVYRSLRRDYETRIIDPSVQEAVKSITARYDAVELVTERATVRGAIEEVLRGRLGKHGILLDQLSITDFAFDADFAKAIENKMVAAQNVLTAENELRTVKVEAEKRVAQADGEAKAIRIQVEAINMQGGQNYIALKSIEKWDGSVPTYMGGNAPIPFLQVK